MLALIIALVSLPCSQRRVERKRMVNTYYFLQNLTPRAKALTLYPYSPNFRQDAF